MRKHFQSDEEIPLPAWQMFPEYKQKLDRIIEMEDKVRSALSSRKRISFAMNAEPETKTKILRIHVRHQFFPSTAHDRAHFIITIEGHLLDKSAAKATPFGNFLDKIRVQLDKRFHPISNVFEWSAEAYPEGVRGQCFRVKAYGDKPFPIKVFLYRSNDIRSRYELSPQLREILPSMQVDPTEEQVLLAFWGHLSGNGMFEGRDRRQIKCSNELKNLFGAENISLSALRQRVQEHLTVCKPIQVEYNVTTTSTVLMSSFGPSAVTKAGGKAFDIEVDIKDPYAFDLLEGVNDISRNQKEMVETISQMEQKASFLASAIIDCSNSIFGDLRALKLAPLPLEGPSPSSLSSSSLSSSSSRVHCDPLISTATGDSSVFPLTSSVPSEMLLRASDPFSLITRRQAAGRGRRVVRPQRGSSGSILGSQLGVDVLVGAADGDKSSVKKSGVDIEGTSTAATAVASGVISVGSVVASSAATAVASGVISVGSVVASSAATTVATSVATVPSSAASTVASSSASSDSMAVTGTAGEEEGATDSPAATATSVGNDETAAKAEAGSVGDKGAGDKMDVEGADGLIPAGIKKEEINKEGTSKEGISPETVPSAAAESTVEPAKEGDVVSSKGGVVLVPVVKGEDDKAATKEPTAMKVKGAKEEGKEEGVGKEVTKEGEEKEGVVVDLVAVKASLKGEAKGEVKGEVKQVKEIKEGKGAKKGAKGDSSSTAEPRPTPSLPVILPRAPDALSAIHGLRGFLDVGNDALFAPSEPWVLSTATLLAKRKLARN